MIRDDTKDEDRPAQETRSDARSPEALADAALDEAQGAGVMETPVGGWGVTGAPQPAYQTLSNVMKNRTQTSSTAIRNIN